MTPMIPIPETVEAIEKLDPDDKADLLAELGQQAGRAQEVVPELVGVSVARLDDELTFTLVATAPEIAVLDAIQYLSGGPCVDAAHINFAVDFDNDDALDEDRWQLFSQATAAHSVCTTLTLPVMSDGEVVGTVNLYAAAPRAFGGHHDELSDIFGAWASAAVSNADLAFTTRREAEAAPDRIDGTLVIDMAIGLTAAQRGLGVEAAEALLRDAALRGGVSLSQLAQEIILTASRDHDPDED